LSSRLGTGIFAGLLLALLAWLLAQGSRPAAPIALGLEAPGFALPALNAGAEVSLASLRGRVVLVNFWATWCKPCEDEMPAMERLYDQLRDEAFEMLAVSVDDGSEEVRAFQERLALSFPILLDRDKKVAAAYQSFRFPETFLIDQEGILVARFIGPKEWDAPEYRDRIRRLLAGEG
jgi:peroxiredoxin